MLSFDNAGTVTCMGLGEWTRGKLVFGEGTCVRSLLVRQRAPRLQLDGLPRCIIALVRQCLARPGLGLLPIWLFFVESSRGGIRPLEVFGVPEEAIKG